MPSEISTAAILLPPHLVSDGVKFFISPVPVKVRVPVPVSKDQVILSPSFPHSPLVSGSADEISESFNTAKQERASTATSSTAARPFPKNVLRLSRYASRGEEVNMRKETHLPLKPFTANQCHFRCRKWELRMLKCSSSVHLRRCLWSYLVLSITTDQTP